MTEPRGWLQKADPATLDESQQRLLQNWREKAESLQAELETTQKEVADKEAELKDCETEKVNEVNAAANKSIPWVMPAVTVDDKPSTGRTVRSN